MSKYDSLNREQKRAVEHTDGPLLLLAGAGSGKTRVLTHRIAYLIDEMGVKPWNILAITFTNKAAKEMRERVDKLVEYGSDQVWVSTFHSMCVRILRRHIDRIGFGTDFSIYDTDDQKTVMKGVIKRLNLDPKMFKERTLMNAISSAKDELISVREYELDAAHDYNKQTIAKAYREYQDTMRRNNALDFDDIIVKTVELFQSCPEVLDNYQERFLYIMVDEYQDTNTAQFELIRLLASKYRNLCVVGDDDQSIYKFRGANIRNILDFEKYFQETAVIKLEQNYRSTQNILDAANAVISNNTNRKDKALWTEKPGGNLIHLRQFDNAFEEAEYIADDIAKKTGKEGMDYKQCAVLYRTNAQSRLLEERMIMEGIPYNVVGGTNFYSRAEIKDILAYLKTIDNGRDEVAVRRIVNIPKRGIGAATLEKLSAHAEYMDFTLYDVMEIADEVPGLGKTITKIRPFVELIDSLREKADELTVAELIREVIEKIDYEEYLKDNDEESADDRMENVEELISKAVLFQETNEEGGLTEFLAEVALVADIDNVKEEDNRVLLMTLHAAKGLEFPVVYLELDADDSQLDCPFVFASAKAGIASMDSSELGSNMEPLFETIVDYIPAPEGDPEAGTQVLISTIDYNEYVGRIGVGKVDNGTIKVNQEVVICNHHEPDKQIKVKVSKLYEFDGLNKVEVKEAGIGAIVAISGISDIHIGDTLCSPEAVDPIPFQKISEPTIAMQFMVNDSPLAGKEGKYVTSRHIRERLFKELNTDVSLRVEETDTTECFKVSGRGELHLSVLVENMRREGFEFAVSKAEVLYHTDENGKKTEPMEIAYIDVPNDFAGAVIEKLGQRKGELRNMSTISGGTYTRLEFSIPARGLIGYRGEFMTDTKGNGIMNTVFDGYAPYKGDIQYRKQGSLIAFEAGETVTYGLFNAQERGALFVGPGEKVYSGMVIGQTGKSEDIEVNVCKKKQLTNTRSSSADEALRLVPPRILSLEQALDFIDTDELLEVTPTNLRIRKKILDPLMRKRASINKK